MGLRSFETFFLLLLLSATGCSAYHPLKEGVGYTDVISGWDTVVVTYSGDSSMSVAETRKYALIRAAEIAALRDMPYFEIASEHVYLTRASNYFPPTHSSYVTTVQNPRGQVRPFIVRDYDPGYTQHFTLIEQNLQARMLALPGEKTIPAAYVLQQARAEKIKLSPGVEEKLAGMPGANGPAHIPEAPDPTTKPIIEPIRTLESPAVENTRTLPPPNSDATHTTDAPKPDSPANVITR